MVSAALVPDLVAILYTLEDLHERAAQFADMHRGFMADSQEKPTNQISDLHSLLTKVIHGKSCCIVVFRFRPKQPVHN